MPLRPRGSCIVVAKLLPASSPYSLTPSRVGRPSATKTGAIPIISQIAGVPLGYFGLVVGLLVSVGAVFPSIEFERTNRSIALLNVIGVITLFLVSVFILGSLCLSVLETDRISHVLIELFY